MRRALDIGAAALVTIYFLGGLAWFIVSARSDGAFDAEQGFIGLAYMTSALAIGLAAIALIRYCVSGSVADYASASPQAAKPGNAEAGRSRDRDIVITQLRHGTFLIVTGVVFGAVFGVVLDDTNGVA